MSKSGNPKRPSPTYLVVRLESQSQPPGSLHNPDGAIDYTDVPPSTTQELKKARRVGRPKSGRQPRQLIAIRIAPELLDKLRKLATIRRQPYQSLIHELLEKATRHVA